MLGEPEAKTASRSQPEIWKYGDLQVSILDGAVVLVGLYPIKDRPDLPAALDTYGYYPSPQTRIDEFQEYLSAEGIKFEAYPVLTFDEQTCLALESGTHVLFRKDYFDSIQLGVGSVSRKM
ncbi:MAG TPA: hypothetical protein VNO70_01625 [Blastocatellia bacterium]|nr:hypothetical protein [Blastocatellia bacterium]